jgi:fido (protein-threonine AMPylation protein)
LRKAINRPLSARTPVTYQRQFVDGYQPNRSSLLPVKLAQDLARAGGMQGQQPAGTYARKVLEPLLIDLSWSSSRLEGNRYSLLATEELFKTGAAGGDMDSVMLLNHKQAIEFMVDAVPEYGLRTDLVSNIHSILMRDLLADSDSLGMIRQKLVNISDTTYLPLQVPAQLAELFALILEKARHIKNPVESAFFLWVNLAYLQPFEDGNKRTSRLTANVPLMLYNCAPLSFMEVEMQDYAEAMIGVYERCDVSLAIDLFAWTYRRSVSKYKVVLESMGAPDPVRLRHREDLNQAIPLVVQERRTVAQAEALLKLTPESVPWFHELLVAELAKLGAHNCARYRVTPRTTQAWVDDGRPQ